MPKHQPDTQTGGLLMNAGAMAYHHLCLILAWRYALLAIVHRGLLGGAVYEEAVHKKVSWQDALDEKMSGERVWVHN